MNPPNAAAVLGDSLLFPAFATCPDCAGAVRGGTVSDLTILLCRACGVAWHVELGVVYRVEC